METLFLQTGTTLTVKLHPVVLFSIVDHYVRRSEGQARVIGTLLGTVHNGVVDVRNCFPVPHVEKSDETVAVRYQYNRQMLALHKRVNPKEDIVGWYATSVSGETVTEFNCLIHDFYASECASPLQLVVDTSMTSSKLTAKAFVSAPLSVAEKSLAQFQQVPVSIEMSESERIGLGAMLTSGSVPEGTTASTLATDVAGLESSMRKLLGMLESVSAYVDDVVEGRRAPDEELGRKIAATLAAVPHMDPASFERLFDDSLQDLLMVSYLVQLMRVQVAVTEKLALPPASVTEKAKRAAAAAAAAAAGSA